MDQPLLVDKTSAQTALGRRLESCWAAWRNLNSYLKCAICLLVYYSIAMIGYSQSERWSTLDIIYFSTITLTTVGYGDIAPKTTGGKLTTIILIYSGILLVGSLLADIFETIFDAHEGVFLEELKEIRREAPPIDDESDAAERMRGLHGLVAEKGKKEVRRGLVSILVLFLAIYLLGILWSVYVGGMGLFDAIYFVTVTISTVGYGDYSGSTLNDKVHTKIWAIFFVLCAVFAFGALLTSAFSLWAGAVRRKKLQGMVDQMITLQDFNRFLKMGDVDQNRRIDMAEFAFICLDELGLLSDEADAATLMAIQHEFKRADKSKSGYIDAEDIIEAESERAGKNLRRGLANTERSIRSKSLGDLLSRRVLHGGQDTKRRYSAMNS